LAEIDELRHARVEDGRVITAASVERDLFARRRIDIAVVVVAVAIEVGARRIR
jgi:hypothetical protein